MSMWLCLNIYNIWTTQSMNWTQQKYWYKHDIDVENGGKKMKMDKIAASLVREKSVLRKGGTKVGWINFDLVRIKYARHNNDPIMLNDVNNSITNAGVGLQNIYYRKHTTNHNLTQLLVQKHHCGLHNPNQFKFCKHSEFQSN